MVFILCPFPVPDKYVRLTAIIPNKSALNCIPIKLNPIKIPSAAPKLVPLATPSVSGVASGFEKRL